MVFITHCDSLAFWQTYISDSASISMEGILIFNKHLLLFSTMVVGFFCLLFTSIISASLIFKFFKILSTNKFQFSVDYLFSTTQPVSVPPANSGDTGSNHPDDEEPPVSSTIATGVLVSNLRRVYKGAQDSIVGILAFDEFADPAVVEAEIDHLKDLFVKAGDAGCKLQDHLDPTGYNESSDQRLYNAMAENLGNLDDAEYRVGEGNIQPLDDFKE